MRIALLVLLLAGGWGCADPADDDDVASTDDDAVGDDDQADDDTTAGDDDVLDDDVIGDDDEEHVSTDCDWIWIDAGWNHTCGVHEDGRVDCWGCDEVHEEGNFGQCDAPAGAYSAVSAGYEHSCALDATGSPTCFGSGSEGAAEPPAAVFGSLSAGQFHTCGLGQDGTLTCWGAEMHNYGQTAVHEGVFGHLSTGPHTCVVDEAGLVDCWGCPIDSGNHGQCNELQDTFTQVAAGDTHSCGLAPDGSVSCWGSNDTGEADPHTGPFVQVVARDHTCSLSVDGSVECWGCYAGSLDLEICEPPDQVFRQVTLGDGYVCGLRDDSCIHCWSDGHHPGAVPP